MTRARLGGNDPLLDASRVRTASGAVGGADPALAYLTVRESDNTPNVPNVTEIVVTNGTLTDNGGGSVSIDLESSVTDAHAIHVNVAAEISGITEKAIPTGDDLIVIEDSAASNVKKRVKLGNLPVISLIDAVNLTGQTADISATNFSGTIAAGIYEVIFYILVTTADPTAGRVSMTVRWTDEYGAQSLPMNNLINLITAGQFNSYNLTIKCTASSSISYETSHVGTYGTAQYSLAVALIKVAEI
jgi:hypothetical protein